MGRQNGGCFILPHQSDERDGFEGSTPGTEDLSKTHLMIDSCCYRPSSIRSQCFPSTGPRHSPLRSVATRSGESQSSRRGLPGSRPFPRTTFIHRVHVSISSTGDILSIARATADNMDNCRRKGLSRYHVRNSCLTDLKLMTHGCNRRDDLGGAAVVAAMASAASPLS